MGRTSGYSSLFIINPGMNLKETKKKYPLKLRTNKNISRRRELLNVSNDINLSIKKRLKMFIGTIVMETIGDVGGICIG